MRLLEESVCWVDRPALDETETTEYRFTLREMSVRNHYNWCRSQVYAWVEEETGISEADFINKAKQRKQDTAKLALATEILLDGTIWAHIYSSLTKTEQRRVNAETLEPTSEWMVTPLPEQWQTPKGFLESTRLDLAKELERVAVHLNPTFHLANDDSKKKFGLRPSNGQSNVSKSSAQPSHPTTNLRKSGARKIHS